MATCRHKEGMVHPRVGVKAIIIHNGWLVAVKKHDEHGPLYSFPGGGQEAGETLVQAVRREVREETGQDGMTATTEPLHINVSAPCSIR